MPNNLHERISNIPEVDPDELDTHLIGQAEAGGTDEPVNWEAYKTRRNATQHTRAELKTAI